MADSLAPGTQVSLIPYSNQKENQQWDSNPFRAAEDKVRQIKNNIRLRLGEPAMTSTMDNIDYGSLTL